MSALDRPVRALQAEYGRRTMNNVVTAAKLAGAGDWLDLLAGVERHPDGTARQALAAIGVPDTARISDELCALERRDSYEADFQRLLDAQGPAPGQPIPIGGTSPLPPQDDNPGRFTTPDQVVSRYAAARKFPQYSGPEGKARFAADNLEAAENGYDLLGKLFGQQRQQAAKATMDQYVRRMDAVVYSERPVNEKLRLLDERGREGRRELEQVIGDVRTLDVPAGERQHGSLVALDAPMTYEQVRELQREIDAKGWRT